MHKKPYRSFMSSGGYQLFWTYINEVSPEKKRENIYGTRKIATIKKRHTKMFKIICTLIPYQLNILATPSRIILNTHTWSCLSETVEYYKRKGK